MTATPTPPLAPPVRTARLAARLLSVPALLLGLAGVVLLALFKGAYQLGFAEVLLALAAVLPGVESPLPESLSYLVWHIRLPRVLLGIVIGTGLAASGAAIQGLFRNPLADPALIGVTSGAMVFAAAGILFATAWLGSVHHLVGYTAVAFMAFIGSLLSTALVYLLASTQGRSSVASMLLAGIAISALGGALTGLMTYFSSEAELRDITFWTLGSLGGANWQLLALTAPTVLLPSFFLLRHSKELDLLLLGEQEAAYMGVRVQRMKRLVVLCTALAVGACVAASGVIAFVALVVPHLVRLARGPSHQGLLLGSALLGSILLVGADTAARTLIAPAELPIGTLTALLGAPFFIWLLAKTSPRL
jgi:iron complex transport system permease protein